jgi:hypothetical protein
MMVRDRDDDRIGGRFGERVRRHWRWGREQGFRRLIEEDRLNPVTRLPVAFRKWRWRRTHSVAPMAMPVYLVGLQRSGTNMLVRGLEESPQVEVRNENDEAAFHEFLLRPPATIRELVARSGHRVVLLKPLCDAHRTNELLDQMGTPTPGRAIWAFRDVDGRVRSAIAKFGDTNLRVLREIAGGREAGLWQAGGLSRSSRELIAGFDYTSMTPESAAALFWYVRNSLYFDLGLDRRDDVLLVSYDRMVEAPEREMRSICAFLDFPYDRRLIAHIELRDRPGRDPLPIDPLVRAHCDELTGRLNAALDRVAGEAGRPARSA